MRRHMGLTADFRFKATPGLRAAMWKAADRDHTNASEFVRRAILEKLRERGLVPIERRPQHLRAGGVLIDVPPLYPPGSSDARSARREDP